MRILLVGDEASLPADLIDYIGDLGDEWQVQRVADGNGAIATIASSPVDAVITVVDVPATAAGQFAANPAAVDAQRKQDPNLDRESPLHELFADQLASADLVILNKADLLDAEALAAVRAEVAEELPPAVKVIEIGRASCRERV